MSCRNLTPAKKLYERRILVVMAFYVALLFLAVSLVQRFHPALPVTLLLAILPALPIVGVIVIVGFYFREETDEFQRNLQMQAFLWSMGGTLAVTSVYGFAESFAPGLHHFPAYYTFILFWLFTGIAGGVQRFQYKAAGDDQ
jgi:hypothetical protein